MSENYEDLKLENESLKLENNQLREVLNDALNLTEDIEQIKEDRDFATAHANNNAQNFNMLIQNLWRMKNFLDEVLAQAPKSLQTVKEAEEAKKLVVKQEED